MNIAKQLNILLADANVDLNRVLIDPLTGGLGYGLEYTYSVMERIRLAALGGDVMLNSPMICLAGEEAWKAKEAKVPGSQEPLWGDETAARHPLGTGHRPGADRGRRGGAGAAPSRGPGADAEAMDCWFGAAAEAPPCR